MTDDAPAPKIRKPRALGIITTLLGASLLPLAISLVGAGGSLYYLFAGITLIASGILTFRGRALGVRLYYWFFTLTVFWSIYEVGFDAWSQLPRLGLFSALLLWFLLPRVRRGVHDGSPPSLLEGWQGKAALAGAAAFVVALFVANWGHEVNPAQGIGQGQAYVPEGDWAHYGSSKRGTRFAPHAQINLDNVDQLERAWVTRTGVTGAFKATPIQIEDYLLLCTGQNVVISLDPDTGAERWRHDPKITTPKFGFWDTCRGVSFYRDESTDPAESGVETVCRDRVLNPTTDARLIALDAKTGELCPGFGEGGTVDLLEGMGEVKPGYYFTTSPPSIARDTIVLGGWVADNQEIEEPSGVVRGFDPITGKLKWAWDLGNEERTGLPPEGESYTRGTPNVWSMTAVDEELGLVYVPTGNATPDYYGGHRTEAMEKYASSIVAIDAETGQARWHFQTVHHDIWDYDVPSQPALVDVKIDGKVRKTVLQATKRSQIFFLDRVTGEPLTEVQERIVPQTDVPMEWTSPTQPFSTGFPSFELTEKLTGADMWGITPLDHLYCRVRLHELRYEGPMTPPSIEGSLYYPGIAGGMNWGSLAVDEVNQLLVVNALHMAFAVNLIPRAEVNEDSRFFLGGRQSGTPYGVRSAPFLSPLFAPCTRPPYGEMAVVDLTTQQVVWRRPVGTSKDMGPLGIPSMLPLPMGMFYQAGSAVTGGGLVFMGGVLDSTMRGINIFTGEEVWTDPLPAPAQATPMSYVSPKTGKQYIVLAVPSGSSTPLGEGASMGGATSDEGGYVIAYALPSN